MNEVNFYDKMIKMCYIVGQHVEMLKDFADVTVTAAKVCSKTQQVKLFASMRLRDSRVPARVRHLIGSVDISTPGFLQQMVEKFKSELRVRGGQWRRRCENRGRRQTHDWTWGDFHLESIFQKARYRRALIVQTEVGSQPPPNGRREATAGREKAWFDKWSDNTAFIHRNRMLLAPLNVFFWRTSGHLHVCAALPEYSDI